MCIVVTNTNKNTTWRIYTKKVLNHKWQVVFSVITGLTKIVSGELLMMNIDCHKREVIWYITNDLYCILSHSTLFFPTYSPHTTITHHNIICMDTTQLCFKHDSHQKWQYSIWNWLKDHHSIIWWMFELGQTQ